MTRIAGEGGIERHGFRRARLVKLGLSDIRHTDTLKG
jgi:hypothetical protein